LKIRWELDKESAKFVPVSFYSQIKNHLKPAEGQMLIAKIKIYSFSRIK